MKLRIILATILLFSLLQVKAQPPETNYLGTVVFEGLKDDLAWGPFNIGFNYDFFGTTQTQFYVNSNGLVTFGASSSAYSNVTIPLAGAPNNYIAAFWDDLKITASGNILYTTIGAAPTRKCVIQWTNMGFSPGSALFGSFSLILYEGSNDVQIQFRSIIDQTNSRSSGNSATIGLENSDGTAGSLYSWNTAGVVSSGKAIRFSPSGSNYTINASAAYDGIYLTKNMALPEPGIPVLISPPNTSTIATSQRFEWSSSTYATDYTLKISGNADISAATDYAMGTNTHYDITGLYVDATYYWAVFATNATGTTWSQINRFFTSATPPLAATPQTDWIEQNKERTLRLQYTGGNESPKTAFVTSLPVTGTLYQYNAGVKGAQITAVPTEVSDGDMRVIYVANGSVGNGAGNFEFLINEDLGDSPEALVTINVSPPGIPNYLGAAKNGHVEIRFDRPMADPSGKESQFTVEVDGSPATISSISLKEGDSHTISVTLTTALTGSELVLVSYTKGDVASESGGLLASFTDQPVTLLVQTITFAPLPDMKWGDSPISLSASASSGLGVTFTSSATSVASVSGTTLSVNNIGTAQITAQQIGDATYAATRYIRSITVGKADQTITFPELPEKSVGDADFSPGATASSGLTVTYSSDNSAVATIVGGNIHIVGAGSAIITASQPGNSFYSPATAVERTLTVNKLDQTITFGDLPVVGYGDDDIYPGATTSSGLTVSYESDNSEVAIVSNGVLVIAGAGTALITASQGGDDTYNAAVVVVQTLTVNKANQTIVFPDLPESDYGDEDIIPKATASSGLEVSYESDNSAVAVITDGVIVITGAGTALITASQGGNTNYNAAADVVQTLIVNKANQTITFPEITTVVYGNGEITPEATASSGLEVSYESDNSAVAEITDGAIVITGAGTTLITASQGGNTNYNAAADVALTLTVNKAELLFTANDLTREYLEENPMLTYTISGFVYDDDVTVLDLLPEIATEATTDSPVGSYVISMTGGEDNNYEYLFVDGELTITKINQTITVVDYPEEILVNDSYTLEAQSTSGLPVSFESMDNDIADISGAVITGRSGGTATIRAYNGGDSNYNPGETTFEVVIKPTHKNVMNLFTPNNDGFNDYWEILDMDELGRCDVWIYDRRGKLVFRSADYHNEWDGTLDGAPLPSAPYYYIIKTENGGTINGTVNIVR